MGKKVKVTWSAVAKIQYYDTLIFWNEHNQSNEYSKKIRAKIKGAPEVYLKTKSGIVFLTQFNPLAVDIDGNPIAISMEMAYRINICSKMYNYYTKEEISWDTLFRKYTLPKEYRYYYDRYYQEFKNNSRKIDSIFVSRKRGVKLWLIARENNS